MVTGRYSGYDEYEGIFGALGSGTRTASRGAGRSLAARHGRSASAQSDAAFGLYARAFPAARRASGRRSGGGALSTNGYERRERYLSERASKRRLKPVDGDGLDDDVDALAAATQPPKQQIWLPTKNFSFRQRAGKLDTRTIARLDLQKIVATTDVESIQRHLENLAFSDVTLEDVEQYSDAYFLKLFQIAQLTVEYLLNVQDSLASHCENLETQCEGLVEECQSLESENQKVEGEIVALKKEIRQKQSTLATFEVMLLNASAAKRASHGLRAMHQQKMDQENDPAVLNILGPAGASPDTEECGAVPLVSSCVLCGKKFISPEYLVRHQQKKHGDLTQSRKKQRKKKRESDASDSQNSSDSGSDSGKPRKRREPRTAPLPAEVIQALNDRNEMTKQLMELQFQLRSEKEKRAEEARQAEQQQAQLANQLTSYMTKLQDTLVDMEKKQEQSKHEMMRYTQEALERAKNEQAERARKKSHAGRIESDDDDAGVRDRKPAATAPEEVEKRILDSLLRAQTEIHHKNSELEQANRKLQAKLRRKARQMQFEPPATTLMSMTAMDAQRFGTDLGLDVEDKPRIKVKSIAVEDKPVQTDEEKDNPRKKRTDSVSQQVQTDIAPVETTPTPEVKPVLRQPPPPLKRAESKISAAIPALVMETPKPAPQPKTTPVEKVKLSSPAVPKETIVVAAEEKKPESKFQHAAHLVGKVARGFLTRRTLQNPSNWLVTLPSASLFHAMNEHELDHLTHIHGGILQDVTVEIEDDMTANDLRVAFADALSGRDINDELDASDGNIDYHRIILHHRRTGEEISGDQFIYHLRNQIDVEIIPSFEAAETHVDHVLGLHEELSSQVRDIRRASMDLTPDEVPLALRVRNREDAEELANRAATRVQSIVRRFLAIRKVEMMKIDRLVEARLVAMRSLTSSPRGRTMSSARSQRQLTRSASVAAIRNEMADEGTVSHKAEQIHARLADLVKQKTGIDTRTKSAKWSRGQLSTEEYDRHVEEMEQQRRALSPEVQQRISEISQRVDKLLDDTYDPVVAKQEEDKYVAASKIQLAVQVAVARKKLKQLLGRSEAASRSDSHATIEQDKQSIPSREEDASDEEAEEKKEAEPEEKKTGDSPHKDDDASQLDVEDLDEVAIKRRADAYEQAAGEKAPPPPRAPTPQPEQKPTVAEAKSKPEMVPRPGTPPPSREDLLGRSPRPQDESRVISPFSKTPLMSRRAAVTRRGSGYDNAR